MIISRDQYDDKRQHNFIIERPRPNGLTTPTKAALTFISGLTEVAVICDLIIADGGDNKDRPDDIYDSLITDVMANYDNIGGPYDQDESSVEEMNEYTDKLYELETTIIDVVDELRKVMKPVINLIASKGEVLDIINVREVGGDAYKITVVFND